MPQSSITIYSEQPDEREIPLASPLRQTPLRERFEKEEIEVDLKLLKDGYANGEVEIMSDID